MSRLGSSCLVFGLIAAVAAGPYTPPPPRYTTAPPRSSYKRCQVGGKDYEHNAVFFKAPCSQAKCNDGKVEDLEQCSYTQQQPKVGCDFVFPNKDVASYPACCEREEVCKCLVDGVYREHRQEYYKAPCSRARCNNGKEVVIDQCSYAAVEPTKGCTWEFPKSHLTQFPACCERKEVCPPPPQKCLVDGVYHDHNAVFFKAPCSNAQCKDGKVVVIDQCVYSQQQPKAGCTWEFPNKDVPNFSQCCDRTEKCPTTPKPYRAY